MNPRPHDEKWRTRTRRALERYFDKRSAPRLILSVLLILTGTAGLLISILLLHAGLEAMSIRYPIAVLAGYGVFLLLLRFWVEFERARFNPESGEIDAALEMTHLTNRPGRIARVPSPGSIRSTGSISLTGSTSKAVFRRS